MEQRIRILGLGIERFFWRRFCTLLRGRLNNSQITLELSYLPYKWSNFQEKCLALMNEFRPDFVFTSKALFKHFDEFDQFLQLYEPEEVIDYPNIFLIEKHPEKLISEYLSIHSTIRFNFRQYPGLRITNPDYFASSKSESAVSIELLPKPELTLKPKKDEFLDSEEKISFVLLSEIEKIVWKGKEFNLNKFLEVLSERFQKDLHEYKGILFVNDKVYLSSGFQVRDLINIRTDSIPIDHIISSGQVKKPGINREVFLNKIEELAKGRCCIRYNEDIMFDTDSIKAKIPITASAENPVLSKILCYILKENGYKKALTVEQISDFSDRLLLNLSYEPDDENILFKNLVLDSKVNDIFGFSELREDQFSNPVSPEDLLDSFQIQKQRDQIFRQIKKIKDQIKVLSSSKAMDDQKRYMDLISRRKLEIMADLLEIAEVWNEQNCDVAVSKDENVLILHDDQHQATQINNHLAGNNRKLFLDVLKDADSLEKLVTLNTDHLEPFLHDGVVICSVSTKAILVKKNQQFRHELSQKKYSQLSEGIDKLKNELQNSEKRMIRLSFLEIWYEVEKTFQQYSDYFFNSAKEAIKHIENRKLRREKIRTVCLCSFNENSCKEIQKAVVASFPRLGEVQYHRIWADLNFSTALSKEKTEELAKKCQKKEDLQEAILMQLAQSNAKKISTYINRISEQLSLVHCDLLIIESNLDLLRILAEMLRDAKSSYKSTPITALFSGNLNVEKMIFLSQNGIKLGYRDQFRKYKSSSLRESLKSVLTIT